MNSDSSAVFYLVSAVIALVLLGVATLRYRITDRAVEVLMFGFVVRRVMLDDIESVRRGAPFWNEHWTNFKLTHAVTLRRKSGLVKNFVITPDNPAEFIKQVAAKLDARG